METKYEVGTVHATHTEFRAVSGVNFMDDVAAIVRENVKNGKGSVLATRCNVLVRWQWNGYMVK